MTVRRLMVLSAIAGSLLLGACAPEAATAEGRATARLYEIFLYVAAFVFLTTGGLIAWSLFRYRERSDEIPRQVHSSTALELVWFAIPQVVVIVLFVLTAMTLDTVNARPDGEAATIRVTGYQWGWRFDYDGDVSLRGTPEEPARVVVPTGEVTFLITSTDVVHAFYVPGFLMKRDAIPGRETRIDVEIEEPGVYAGSCAEFCGLLHDRMTFSVEAVSQQDYESWLQEQAP